MVEVRTKMGRGCDDARSRWIVGDGEGGEAEVKLAFEVTTGIGYRGVGTREEWREHTGVRVADG